jgi:uncharacterized protein YbjT (DUF2867 family)
MGMQKGSGPSTMIVITGATGTIGRELLMELLGHKVPFRAIMRSTHHSFLKKIPGEFLHHADLQDPQGRKIALAGVTKLFLCTPLTDYQLNLQQAILETALANGVQHVVKIGTIVTEKDNRISHAQWHQQIEKKIQESGISWTFLRPTLFASLPFEAWARGSSPCSLMLPLRNGRIPLIAPRDVASAACKALTDTKKMRNQAYSMTGPEALSMAQVAIILSHHLKESFEYHDTSSEQFIEQGKKLGLPPWLSHDLAEMFEYFAFNRGSQLCLLPSKVIQKPHSFREFLTTSSYHWQSTRPLQTAS